MPWLLLDTCSSHLFAAFWGKPEFHEPLHDPAMSIVLARAIRHREGASLFPNIPHQPRAGIVEQPRRIFLQNGRRDVNLVPGNIRVLPRSLPVSSLEAQTS